MRNVYKRLFVLSMLFGWLSYFAWGTNIQLNLEIQWIGIRHGTPDNLDLWSIIYSAQEQEVPGQFDNYFWIEDLMWMVTWHYTTIQCDWLYGPDWAVITWIYLKAGNINPVRMMWNTWNVAISSTLSDYQSIYDPIVYFYKPTNITNIWKANKYWDIPSMKIVIPPETVAGDYVWTITFSLYME